MGYFDRFRRKKSVDVDDVGDYYTKSRKTNPIIALLLGILSFLITLAILWLLFLGGRWVYRQIMGNDSNKQPSTTQQTASNDDQKEGNSSSQGNTSSTSTNKPSGSSSQPNGTQPSSGGNSASGGASTPPATTPALGDGADLPRTGDEGL